MEKDIMDTFLKEKDFENLIDNIMIYSNYSFFNSLLASFQYPDFLDLNTKNKYIKQGVRVLDNAKKVEILSAINDEYVKIKNGDMEDIKLINELNKEEKKKYFDRSDNTVIGHHRDFKGLKIIELYDCKDTTMEKKDYKQYELPILFFSKENDVYNPFIKALYAAGYKIVYCDNLNTKCEYNEATKLITLNNGLNCKIKMMCLLDIYTSDISLNDFEKGLFTYTINKNLGIDDEFTEKNSFLKWYKENDIEDVERSFKVISSKCKKFVDNFNRFCFLEQKELDCEKNNLYDNFDFMI